MWEASIYGFVLAFGLILPLGVQNVFIFNQGAAHPKLRHALPAVITAALCDTLLILLAVAGVSLVVLTINWLKTLLFIIGALFMLYMGWSIWRSRPELPVVGEAHLTAGKQIVFAVSVSLLNPHAIMDTIGVIGTSSLRFEGLEKGLFTAAAIGVSWTWFFGLCWAGRLIGGLDSSGNVLRHINKLSAIIVWAMAGYIIIQLL
ncbi:LysE/ArgO family amino acid transporter [Paenibacillus lentus]|uniref:LysE/ArgO family amino acid transporter n=1 Tax=Paenibacillus lentus TaxID=1338368 RepID=UPI0036692720